jgi:Flp pilus assembly protein TadG
VRIGACALFRAKSLVHARGRGQALVEAALVLPIMLMLVLGVFAVGVVGRTDAALLAVAEEAARAAATSTTATDAAAHGVDRGTQVAAGYRLQNTIVTVDARDFRPGMTGGRVRADATVTVSLAGISIFGPLAITLHHQHVEPVDPYRNVRP